VNQPNLIALFLFYERATGPQAILSFSREFKHCNIITFDGRDWIMLDFDRSGLITRKINCKNGQQLIRNIRVIQSISAIISVALKERKKVMWKPFWGRSCNEICRYAAGIDIGLTFNPRHLYSKLLKYSNKRNYEILSVWRRKNGISRGRQ
jgi:hypothetical protein